MSKNTERVPLSNIELLEQPLSPVKPHIKILKKKHPEDFFILRPGIHSSTEVVRGIQRNTPLTSNFPRKSFKEPAVYREALTARTFGENKDEDLIMGILKSARQMKKVFRKHSIQIKKEQIPKRRINQFDLQLPPLLLKKGFTTAL